jgi:hypothetical protein
MPNLLPFRDYNEHDVINLYSCTTVANKGTLVKPVRSPKDNDGTDSSTAGPLKLTSNGVGKRFQYALSDLFDIVGQVSPIVNYNDTPAPIGILLYSVQEVDENGEKLIYSPQKAAEKNVVLPNTQAAPILTKGLVLINDIDVTNRGSGGGDPDIGDAAYVGDGGRIGTDGLVIVGKFLSKKDENGYCLVKINL